jgi:hypothetical protein
MMLIGVVVCTSSELQLRIFGYRIRITMEFLQEKAVKATKQKEEKRMKNLSPMKKRHATTSVLPSLKRRGDRNPECHEEQHKDVA